MAPSKSSQRRDKSKEPKKEIPEKSSKYFIWSEYKRVFIKSIVHLVGLLCLASAWYIQTITITDIQSELETGDKNRQYHTAYLNIAKQSQVATLTLEKIFTDTGISGKSHPKSIYLKVIKDETEQFINLIAHTQVQVIGNEKSDIIAPVVRNKRLVDTTFTYFDRDDATVILNSVDSFKNTDSGLTFAKRWLVTIKNRYSAIDHPFQFKINEKTAILEDRQKFWKCWFLSLYVLGIAIVALNNARSFMIAERESDRNLKLLTAAANSTDNH